MTVMEGTSKYLYCIIRCAEERTFDGVAALGGPQAKVYTIPHGSLAAVVSDSPLRSYESTRSSLLAHTQVQEKVMKEFSLLPVRFGTVASGRTPVDDIGRLLEKRSSEFESVLRETETKVELGLKVFWRDLPAVFQEVLAESVTIRQQRDSLLGMPAQVRRLQGISLGARVQQALQQKREGEAERLLAPLLSIAARTQRNEVLGDRMVANVAFLVDREKELEFDRCVRVLDRELGRRLAFKYVGPVPPYNFVNITVNWQEL